MNSRTPVQKSIDIDHMHIGIHQWGTPAEEKPTVVLLHATGFHGRVWDKVCDQLHDYPIIAIDLRGHGSSDSNDFSSWRDFGEDVAATLRKLQLKHVVLVGHSLGAVAAAVAAHIEPVIIEKVLMMDPVILPPMVYQHNMIDMSPAEKATRARQAEFESIEAMINRYSAREPFQLFQKDVFEDYCRHGLVWQDDKQCYTLACSPEFEAKVYNYAGKFGEIFETLEQLEQRVHVLRAMPPPDMKRFYGFAFSPTYAELVKHLKNGKDIVLSEHSHFIPQQDPATAAEHIKALIDEQ